MGSHWRFSFWSVIFLDLLQLYCFKVQTYLEFVELEIGDIVQMG